MGLIAWIVTGLLAGWIGGLVTGRRGQGCLATLAIGMIGALVASALARAAGLEGIDEFGLRNILLSALGAALLLFVFAALEGRNRSD